MKRKATKVTRYAIGNKNMGKKIMLQICVKNYEEVLVYRPKAGPGTRTYGNKFIPIKDKEELVKAISKLTLKSQKFAVIRGEKLSDERGVIVPTCRYARKKKGRNGHGHIGGAGEKFE